MPLYDKEGNPIEYTKDSYNPITQQNEKVDTDPPKWIGKGTIITGGLDPSANKKTITDYNPIYLSPEDYDEDYDRYGPLGTWDEIEQNRIRNQSNWARAGRATFGGLMKGVGTALKDIGYMLDWRTYAKLGGAMDMEEEGYLNEALNTVGDWIHEGVDAYAPIYERGDSKALTDQLMKWSTVSSVLDSAVGFAIPGGVASKIGTLSTKGLAQAGKLMKWTGRIQNLPRMESAGIRLARANESFNYMQKAMPQLSNNINTIAPAIMQGAGEGMWEAKDAYSQHIASMSDLILTGQANIQDINNQANDIAQNVLRLNMAKTFLNFHIFSSISTKFGKGLIKKKPTMGAKLTSMAKEIPLEMAEEGGQEIFKKESEYRTMRAYEDTHANSPIIKELQREGRYSKDLSKDFYTRMAQLISTNDVLLSGIIGGISGPIQHAMMRGVGAKKRFKAQVEAYEKQQEFIKDKSKLFDSKESFNALLQSINTDNAESGVTFNSKSRAAGNLAKTVDKVALSERLIDLANDMDNDDVRELVKKQAYTTIIQEHVAAGTYEFLKDQADKYAGTDHHMADMAAYIRKVQPILSKADRYLNRGVVFNKAMSVQLTKDLQTTYQQMYDRLVAERETKDTETLEEHDNLLSLKNTIKKMDKSIAEAEEDLSFVTTLKHQRLLAQELMYDNELTEARAALHEVPSLNRLMQIAKLYPELIPTKEFAAKAKDLRSKPTGAVKAEKVAVGKKTDTEIVKDAQRSIDKTQQVEEGLTAYDKKKKRIINSDQIKVTKNNVPVLSEENVATRISNRAKDITDKISTEELDDITQKVYKQYDENVDNIADAKISEDMLEMYIDKAIGTYIKTDKQDVQEELEASELEINMLNRRSILNELPEENIINYVTLLNKVNTMRLQVDSLKQKPALTPEESQILANSQRELHQVDQVMNTIMDKILLSIREDTTVNPEFKQLNEVFPDLTDFLVYTTSILGEDFVSQNFITIKKIFREATEYSDTLPATFVDAMGDILEYGVPEDMPSSQRNTAVLNAKSPETLSTTFDNVVEEFIGEQKRVKGLNNLDPSNSIAHLSQSYHVEQDDEGNNFIEEDAEATQDLAVFLNPYKYNNKESISFEVASDYEGDPQFNEMRHLILNADGSIREDSPEFNQYLKENGMPGDSTPDDFVPIRIIGPNDEDFKFVHLPSWASKIRPEDVETQREKIRQQRAAILKQIRTSGIAQGNLDKKVMYMDPKQMRYKGFVMNDSGKPVVASQAIPEKVTIGLLGTSGAMINNKISPEQILNYSYVSTLPPGMAFTLVPLFTKDKKTTYHAEALFNEPLSNELSNTALTMITAYLTGDLNNPLIDNFKLRFNGLDISKPKGLETALNRFMYVFKPKSNIEAELRYNRNKASGKNALFSVDKTTGAISFGIGEKQTVLPIGKEGSDQDTIANAISLLDKFFKTGKFMFNIDKGSINTKNFPVIMQIDGKPTVVVMDYNDFAKQNSKTTLIGSKLKDGSYTYTLQNIVTFTVNSEAQQPKVLEDETEVGVAWKNYKAQDSKLVIKTTKGNPVKSVKRLSVFQQTIEVLKADDSDSIINQLKLDGFIVNDETLLKTYLDMEKKDGKYPMPFEDFVLNYKSISDKSVKPPKKLYTPSAKTIASNAEGTVQGVLDNLGVPDITIDMTADEIANITDSTNEANIIKELIDIEDLNGLQINIPFMRFYKERNPIENDTRYKNLSEDDQADASDLYKINRYNINKIFTLVEKKQLEATLDRVESGLFNKIQELEKRCD